MIDPVLDSLRRSWRGRLAHYARHSHGEHLEALVEDVVAFVLGELSPRLADSPYWSEAPWSRQAAVLLMLMDHGVVRRIASSKGRVRFKAVARAEEWAKGQGLLVSHLSETLEFLAAINKAPVG